MRFYRCDYRDRGSGSHGFSFHTSRRDAEATAAKKRSKDDDAESISDVEIETVDIEPTKQGILHALNAYGKHADNG